MARIDYSERDQVVRHNVYASLRKRDGLRFSFAFSSSSLLSRLVRETSSPPNLAFHV